MSGLRLEDLARARGLAPALLRRLGWEQRPNGVAIPWAQADGTRAWHIRHRIEREGPGARWTWEACDRGALLPYGAERLETMKARHPAAVVVVESELDAVALWTAGQPALATGGADGWQDRWWPLLAGFERVVVWVEDNGSVPLLRRLATSRPPDGPPLTVCHALNAPEKDAGRLRARLDGRAGEVLQAIVARAVPVEVVDDLLQAVTDRLGARRRGESYAARCPLHDDRNPSLSIFHDTQGWRFKCHGGAAGRRGPWTCWRRRSGTRPRTRLATAAS
jgi:hypothetical protein